MTELRARLRDRLLRLRDATPVVGLRMRFAVAFACVAALVALLVGGLTYDSAANLIRNDRAKEFQQAQENLVAATQEQTLSPDDFAASYQKRERLDDRLTLDGGLAIQVLDRAGRIAVPAKPDPLPVGVQEKRLAEASSRGLIHDRWAVVSGDSMKVVTVSLGGGRGAVQLAERMSATEDLLDTLRERTALLALCVVVAAGGVGWWVAGRITRRLVRLTGSAEEVASTGRLDTDVPVAGRDEVGRLGRAFDHMLGRLARSKDDQRRLVQDAGHELRTPLTSLRTNLAALKHYDRLPEEQRAALLEDLSSETRELSSLVNELVELAADRREEEEPVEVLLVDLAERVAALASRRNGREIRVLVSGDPEATVTARPAAIQRALSNLLENASKFDRPEQRRADGRAMDEPITVVVRGPVLTVLDRGPGIDEDDLQRIFDRFYRATAARSLPGSGLGLSIVQDVARLHGGRVFARNRPGGGAEIGFSVGPAGSYRGE
jgi:two-component system sensor histidine kinase MprB